MINNTLAATLNATMAKNPSMMPTISDSVSFLEFVVAQPAWNKIQKLIEILVDIQDTLTYQL